MFFLHCSYSFLGKVCNKLFPRFFSLLSPLSLAAYELYMRFFAHLQHVVQFFTTLVLPRNVFLMSEDDAVECGQNRTNTHTHTQLRRDAGRGLAKKKENSWKTSETQKCSKSTLTAALGLETRIEKVRRKLKQNSGTLKRWRGYYILYILYIYICIGLHCDWD